MELTKLQIGIVGLGYVGLTLGIAAADCGLEVFGTEINPVVKASLKENPFAARVKFSVKLGEKTPDMPRFGSSFKIASLSQPTPCPVVADT